MAERFDVVVLGLGGVGSAALLALAKRGVKAVGVDRFPPGHDRGSSHGDSRVIRLAYFEHPDYVPLLRRSYELWAELERAAGKKLYHETGILQAGPADGEVVPGVREAAARHKLEIDVLTAAEANKRFPGFRVPETMMAVFERRAGYLRVEACVRAQAEQALRLGAKLAVDDPAVRWKAVGGGVEVECGKTSYSAAKLIVAAGAWAPGLLDVGVRFEVLRKPFFFFEPGRYAASAGCPVFLFETPSGEFYGIPGTDRKGLKAAEHTGGRVVEDPSKVDRDLDPADLARVDRFLEAYLPACTRRLESAAVCLYTMSPDRNFVVDVHPAHPEVAFAAGLSGHGFKFVPALGEALSELVLDGRSRLPVAFLAAGRPKLS